MVFLFPLLGPNLISIKPPAVSQQKEEVPVPKARRVFPEHEGKYKITMPAGTTAKTRKILEEQGLGTCNMFSFGGMVTLLNLIYV